MEPKLFGILVGHKGVLPQPALSNSAIPYNLLPALNREGPLLRTKGEQMKRLLMFLALVIALLAYVPAQAQLAVRVGHMANITHPQALAGRANAAFDKVLAPSARVEWKAF